MGASALNHPLAQQLLCRAAASEGCVEIGTGQLACRQPSLMLLKGFLAPKLTRISLPDSAAGSACAWIAVGFSYLEHTITQ